MTTTVETEQVAVQLLTRTTSWPDQARSLGVNDSESYEFAGASLQHIKSLRAEIADAFDPMQSAAHSAWKEVIAQRKRIEDPLTEAERIIKNTMSRYSLEVENARRAEQRRLEDAERKKREAELAKAAKKGASAEELQQIEQRPVMVMAPSTPKPSAEGISTRKTYKARVTNLGLLIKHVAANPSLLGLLEPNQTALNELARSLREGLSLPGVELYVETNVAARRS